MHKYLMRFFGNLLLGENNELKNRHLRIEENRDADKEQNSSLKINSGGQKVDLGGQKKWSVKGIRLLELIYIV